MMLESGPMDDKACDSSLAHESTIASSADAGRVIVGFCTCRDIVLCVDPNIRAISV